MGLLRRVFCSSLFCCSWSFIPLRHRSLQHRQFRSRGSLLMMPEGPEVRCLAEDLNIRYGNDRFDMTEATILSGRYTKLPPIGWQMLQSALPLGIKNIASKGKFIWFDCGPNCYLFSTLGLSGDWIGDATHSPPSYKYGRIVFSLIDRHNKLHESKLLFVDMIGYGTVKVVKEKNELDKKLKSLGVCWLSDRPSYKEFLSLASKEKPTRPVARFLMDQKKFAGIGNYILSEVLYRAGIHPFALCGSIAEENRWEEVYIQCVIVISSSYYSQKTTQVPPLVQLEGIWATPEALSNSFHFQAYRQKQCQMTGNEIVKSKGPHGRAIFWSPSIQAKCTPLNSNGVQTVASLF